MKIATKQKIKVQKASGINPTSFLYEDSEIVSVRTPRKEITLTSEISVLH